MNRNAKMRIKNLNRRENKICFKSEMHNKECEKK